MRVGTLIQCLGMEQMLATIHALRGNGIQTKQTDKIFELEVTEIKKVNEVINAQEVSDIHKQG